MNGTEFYMRMGEILDDGTGRPRGEAFDELVEITSAIKGLGVSVLGFLYNEIDPEAPKTYLVRRKVPNEDGKRFTMLITVVDLEHLFWTVDEFDDPFLYEYAEAEDGDGVCAAYKLVECECTFNHDEDQKCEGCEGENCLTVSSTDDTLSEKTALDIEPNNGIRDWEDIPTPKIYKTQKES